MTWLFVLLAAVALVAAVVCAVAWKVAYDDGREAGILHERNTRNLRAIRERREARTDREIGEWDQWARQLREPGERLAASGELRALEGGLSDTGTMAAVTDDYIARMAAEEAAYREGLAS